MDIRSKFLDGLATKWLSRHEQIDNLKKIAQKKDWKVSVEKCHDRITEQYKFWVRKSDSIERERRLRDLEKDVKFIKSIQGRGEITGTEKERLHLLVNKYGIE